jgi:hypothetical protein
MSRDIPRTNPAKIDTNTNLLPDLFPHDVVGDALARDFELLQILQEQFQSAHSDGGTREVIFPNSDPPRYEGGVQP